MDGPDGGEEEGDDGDVEVDVLAGVGGNELGDGAEAGDEEVEDGVLVGWKRGCGWRDGILSLVAMVVHSMRIVFLLRKIPSCNVCRKI